ncbi:ATP-binding protein [Phaeobacter sp. B1627]|uniref:hybrid sensor histidine kinase/response regulator n=1 Tax=Phaeobacter sp. B1627 TaxID=2583809 RepID=UPI002103F5FB|nr:ATP-binding protein [Phaeobacter sp. B1627]
MQRWLIAAAAVVLILLAVQSVRLGKDVQRRIEALASAATDNLQWNLSQAEVDYLKYQRSVFGASTAADLPELRRQFDIYYSRVATYRESALYAKIRDNTEGGATLERIKQGLTQQAGLIDSSDDVLLGGLDLLRQLVAQDGDDVRKLALIGVVLQAETAGVERVILHTLFLRLSIVVVTLLLALTMTALLILWLYRRGQRLAYLQAQDAARAEAMVTSSLDAILMADESGRITAMNGAAEQIFDYSADEAMGMPFERLVSADPAKIAAGQLPEGMGERDGRIQLTATRKSGACLPVEVSLTVSRSAGNQVLVSYVRDISRRLRAEEELRQARDDALAGVKARDRLLTVMSHEMRTPLTGILGSLDILDDMEPSLEQQKFLQAMRVSGELLLHHVNDVLELSRLEAGAEFETARSFDLEGLVHSLVDSQQANAQKNSNDLSVFCSLGPEAGVIGRARSIQQILLNLIGNALKFTKEGAVSVDVIRKEDDRVEFSVADTGKGIAAEHLDHIFDDFMMIDPSYTRGSEGTGLGLAISQRLVKLMDGQISCDSELGEGSTFSFTIPLPPSKLIPQDKSPKKVDAQRAKRILVIEDNDVNRLLLEKMLGKLGHEVVCAAGGGEGIAALRAQAFDLILTDISMPEIDGLEVLSRARAERLAEGVDIVALTAHAAAEDHARILAAGFAEVLTKPISRADLGDLVDRRSCSAPPVTRPKRDDRPSETESDIEQFIAAVGREKAQHFLSVFRSDMHKLGDTLARSPQLTTDHRQEAHRLAGSAAVLGLAELRDSMLAIEQVSTDEVPMLDGLYEAWATADTLLGSFVSH